MSGDAYETFAWPQAVETMTLIASVRREAIALGRKDIQLAVSKIGVDLQRKLDTLSKATAKAADEAIRRKLRETQRRPLSDRPVHLADAIKSIQFGAGLGIVKVALVDELNKAVNPGGYGPYWRAIEEGSVEVGNPMTGRRLYGTFFGGGSDPERPRAAYRRDAIGDAAMAPHSDFEMGGGDDPGKGIIHTEIEGRHFLQRGTDEAWDGYVTAIKKIDHETAQRILELSAV